VRIVILSERWWPDAAGGEVHIKEIVKEFVKRGCKITILARDLGEFGEEGEINGAEVISLGFPSNRFNLVGRISFLFSSLRWLIRHRNEYDLINAQAYTPTLPAMFMKEFYNKPITLTVHGTFLGRFDNKLRDWMERMLIYRSEFDLTITVDEEYVKFAREFGLKNKIVYVPNGVDVERFRGKENRQGNKILFVGRLFRQKGLKYLMEAFKKIKGDYELIIVGKGPEEKELKELAEEDNRVKFLGYVDRVEQYYLSSDIFVLPSVWEGTPLVLLEAWAARLPVIATRVGGVREIASSGDTYLIEPKNVEQLETAIEALLGDEKLRRKFAQNAYRKAKEHSWHRVANKMEKEYKLLLENSGEKT